MLPPFGRTTDFLSTLLGVACLLSALGASEKIKCNDDIDSMLADVNADIKARSPIEKTDKPMCDFVRVYGAHTIVREGDIYGEDSPNEPGCFLQNFKIKFESLNVSCNVNMEKLMEQVNRVVKEMVDGRRKKRGIKLGGLKNQTSGVMEIIWNNMCLSGKIKVCHKDKSQSQADNIKLCSLADLRNCDIKCDGSLQLRSLCEDDNFLKKLRETIGVVFQEVMQREFTQGLREGPSQILEKFNCGKLANDER